MAAGTTGRDKWSQLRREAADKGTDELGIRARAFSARVGSTLALLAILGNALAADGPAPRCESAL